MSTAPAPAGTAAPPRPRSALPGLVVVTVVAALATAVGHWVPLLGAPVAGIVLGVTLSGAARRRPRLAPGVRFASGFLLQLAVVVLGAQLSLGQVAGVGVSSLPVMLGTLAACLLAAAVLGRGLGIDADLRTLIGVGTGICGASAIAAVSPVIRARSTSVAYAVSTIFCFNVAAVLLFPPLGHLLHLGQDAFGLFAGTAVNDTSSVVAAATTYGPEATSQAVVVKLTRTLLIIPITLVLGAVTSRSTAAAATASLPRRVVRLVPWFLVGFLALAAANSLGALPAGAHAPLQHLSVFLVTIALTAIGLSTDIAGLRRAGPRPLLLGGLLWLVVSATSLLLQWAAG
ncbi:MAG TPA: putative sulfate exporter family transporter [Marmoricola sp.]|nr:putative sulfate exporter family transporter [Marmoricola sp.]